MQNKNQPLSINTQRLQQFIDDFAFIGGTEKGGVTRLALTDEDKQARDLFIDLAKKAGCTIKIDAMGNIFARRAGIDNNLEPVLVGSHIDSQPQGGRFDGIYGVLAALEAVCSLNDHEIQTLRPIDVVSWTNEEGARFAPAMIGSAVFTRIAPLEKGLECKDIDGLTIREELERIGYAGTDNFDTYKPNASLEIHIEQGPVLEDNQKMIGVVTGTLGIQWYNVQFNGVAAHAGTTPLKIRQDASLGMAKAILEINKLGLKYGSDARATVGKIEIKPNSPNVVPSQALFSVEFRHSDMRILKEMEIDLESILEKAAKEYNLIRQLERTLSLEPVEFSPKCINVVRQTVEKLGYSQQDIISGAGHDSCNVNNLCHTSMIFIPCIKGISHNEAEDIKPEWGEAGAKVLLNSIINLANEVEK